MSGETECCRHVCSRLRREVVALERLIDRYQEELETTSVCRSCGRRAYAELLAAEEEVYEHQRLDTMYWDLASGDEMEGWAAPRYTRRNGQRCQFTEVVLPSNEWVWTSDWHIDVHSKTDSNGWTYGILENFESNLMVKSDRTTAERARWRRWKRERTYVGSVDLPPSTTDRLESKARMSALQAANEKLTEQLRRANEQILDYEDRLKLYESSLQRRKSTHSTVRLSEMKSMSEQMQPVTNAPPFSPSKSREVLNQTEALLNQILGTSPRKLVEDTHEVQRRRSEMVVECQNELDSAVSEFRSHVRTLNESSAAAPGY